MLYRCLRDCYVGDMLWHQGKTYELPDDMVKSEKNFQPIEQPVEVEPEQVIQPVSDTPEKPREPKSGEYLCSKCHSIHRESSKLGQKHLKYKQEE